MVRPRSQIYSERNQVDWRIFQESLEPAEKEQKACDEVTYVTRVPLAGWLFPGEWANGQMQDARFCKDVHLGTCAEHHLHARVSAGEETAELRWEVSRGIIHSPTQQADLAAAIVMEASSVDDDVLHVADCRVMVNNTKAMVEWCQAPFCSNRHVVLTNPQAMSQYERGSREEAAICQIPWVLPSNRPGWPVELRDRGMNSKERDTFLERMARNDGARVVKCPPHEPGPKPWQIPDRYHKKSLESEWKMRKQTPARPMILIGSEMVKNLELWDHLQTRNNGKLSTGQTSWPKKVFDIDTNMAVQCSPGMEYAALSYVWAQHSEKTTISTLRRLSAELGIRYWWVDRLCMKTAQEKAEEIPLMAGYYRNAVTTVIYDREMVSKAATNIPFHTTWTAADLWLASKDFRSRLLETTWANRVWTLQEFQLANRILVATLGGLAEGYFLGSWAQAMKVTWHQGHHTLCFPSMPWYVIDVRVGCGGMTRRILEPVADTDGLGPPNFTLSPSAEPPKLSLGAAWKRAKGRQCTQQEDLVYGMVALLDQAHKVVVEYDIGWSELMRRCCYWGLITSDIMTSGQICSEMGMHWAPEPSNNRVPELTDWEMTPVPMALEPRGCEARLAQIAIRPGPASGNGRDIWGAFEVGGVEYSASFRGIAPPVRAKYTGLVVAERLKELLVILAQKHETDGEVFCKVGMCEVVVNPDEDDIVGITIEKVIIA